MRDRINTSLKEAMRAKDSLRLGTLRLMNAAIKDQDIAARGAGNSEGVSDSDILAVLTKMVKQRKESGATYAEAGRDDLAKQELAEIKVIEEFLPKQLSDEEARNAVEETIQEIGAESIRDMGKVMGALKGKYSGQLDFGKAGAVVKELLG